MRLSRFGDAPGWHVKSCEIGGPPCITRLQQQLVAPSKWQQYGTAASCHCLNPPECRTYLSGNVAPSHLPHLFSPRKIAHCMRGARISERTLAAHVLRMFTCALFCAALSLCFLSTRSGSRGVTLTTPSWARSGLSVHRSGPSRVVRYVPFRLLILILKEYLSIYFSDRFVPVVLFGLSDGVCWARVVYSPVQTLVPTAPLVSTISVYCTERGFGTSH